MLFVAPALIFYIIFAIKPIINTIELSFYKWDGASTAKAPKPIVFRILFRIPNSGFRIQFQITLTATIDTIAGI